MSYVTRRLTQDQEFIGSAGWIRTNALSRLPINSRAHYHSATAEKLVEHSGIEPDDGNLARIARYPIDVPL